MNTAVPLRNIHSSAFIVQSFYDPDFAAKASAIVAQLVAAAEMNWCFPYGKPASKCGWSGDARRPHVPRAVGGLGLQQELNPALVRGMRRRHDAALRQRDEHLTGGIRVALQ